MRQPASELNELRLPVVLDCPHPPEMSGNRSYRLQDFEVESQNVLA